MAVPKKKTSHSKTRMRASHHAIDKLCLAKPNTVDAFYSHHVSSNGVYKGVIMIPALARKFARRQQGN